MTGYVTTAAGAVLRLPQPLEWTLVYTGGVPCDSFRLTCPWREEDSGADPAAWCFFRGEEEGETVFQGIVDECTLSRSARGRLLELSGRGMAALLLDNEAMAQDYPTATLQDILQDHVLPFGVQVGGCADLPPVSPFSVAAGSSAWSVLYQFARYYGGVSPWFDQEGRLWVQPRPDQTRRVLTGDEPALEAQVRHRRYGVLSEIWVRDRYRQTVEKVPNQDFLDRGGRRRQILTMPGRSTYQAMRYSGAYQIQRSQAQELLWTLTLPGAFRAWPGELVQAPDELGGQGVLRVAQSTVALDAQGVRTTLELARRDAVL